MFILYIALLFIVFIRSHVTKYVDIQVSFTDYMFDWFIALTLTAISNRDTSDSVTEREIRNLRISSVTFTIRWLIYEHTQHNLIDNYFSDFYTIVQQLRYVYVISIKNILKSLRNFIKFVTARKTLVNRSLYNIV